GTASPVGWRPGHSINRKSMGPISSSSSVLTALLSRRTLPRPRLLGARERVLAQEPGVASPDHRLGAGGRVELAIDRLRLSLDRVGRNVDSLPDLAKGKVARQIRSDPK